MYNIDSREIQGLGIIRLDVYQWGNVVVMLPEILFIIWLHKYTLIEIDWKVVLDDFQGLLRH